MITMDNTLERIGWVLVHFVWQAGIAALVLAILLRVLRMASANVRYVVACAAMALVVLLPAVTISVIGKERPANLIVQTANSDTGSEIKNVKMITLEIPTVKGPSIFMDVPKPIEASLKEKLVSEIRPGLPYVVAGWFVGVVGLSIWYLGGWAQLLRLKRRMIKQVTEPLQRKVKELAEVLGVRQAVDVVESGLVAVPAVIGWMKPVILLPASALMGLTAEQLEAILAHELAHIKRWDYLVNMVQTVVEILGFYHPAVWWISRRIRVERENCCDDLAAGVAGREQYAKALVTMAEIRAEASPSLAVAVSGGSLFERICRLVGKTSIKKERAGWMPSLAAILLVGLLIVTTGIAMNSGEKSLTTKNTKEEKQIGSKLEFRVAVLEGELAKEVQQQYISELAEKGPVTVKEGEFAWFEIRKGILTTSLIMGKYDQRLYVLVRNKEPYVMLADGWGLEKSYATTDQQGRPAVGFEFDENGGKLFYNLTKANIKKPLAIIVDGKVLAAPRVMDALSKGGIITGTFTKEEVDKLVESLRRGMPPVKALEATPLPTGFEATVEKTLKHGEYIDLDKGNTFVLPSAMETARDVNAMTEWVKGNGIDAQCVITKRFGSIGEINSAFMETYNKAWEQMSADDVKQDISQAGKPMGNLIKAGEQPETYLFKTREGAMGILQITEFDKNSIKIRYKIAQAPSKSIEEEKLVDQILTTGYILSVPPDLPQLKEIVSDDKSKPIMITPQKFTEFFNFIKTSTEARIIAAPKLLQNDGLIGDIIAGNVNDINSLKLNIKNTIQPDKKSVRLEVDFEYSCKDANEQKSTTASTVITLPDDYATALVGDITCNGQKVVLLVRPKILEKPVQKTGEVRDSNERDLTTTPDKNTRGQEDTKEEQNDSGKEAEIDVEKLAEICEGMEGAFSDIILEYEWDADPSKKSIEECAESIRGANMLVNVDVPKYKFSVARRGKDKAGIDRYLIEESVTVMGQEKKIHHETIKKSWNGKIFMREQISSFPEREFKDGSSSKKMPEEHFVISPLGFSVLRFRLSEYKTFLSDSLRQKEYVTLDKHIQKVNGFNTIRVQLLTKPAKYVYNQIYFSVDHGYTPVRYEYMGGADNVKFTVDITSLEEVAAGLWFPSGGVISNPKDDHKNIYRAMSAILVNQGLGDEYFDVKFAAGTKVEDSVKGTKYIVEATKEQQEKLGKEKKYLEEHAAEIEKMRKEGGRLYSMEKLMRFGTAKGVYVMDKKKQPASIEDLKPYIQDANEYLWIAENVKYLGPVDYNTAKEYSTVALAYDKNFIKKGEGTAVLYLDGHVGFLKPEELVKLGFSMNVEGDGNWGKAVEGVQCRLRPISSVWMEGQEPVLALDLRNGGEKKLISFINLEIEIDNVWYWGKESEYAIGHFPELRPGENSFGSLKIRLNDSLAKIIDHKTGYLPNLGEHLKLGQGKHTVRFRFNTRVIKEYDFDTYAEKYISVVSNPVEVKILAEEELTTKNTTSDKDIRGQADTKEESESNEQEQLWQMRQLTEKLKQVCVAINAYAIEHNGELPVSLVEVKPYEPNEEIYKWAIKNVEYLGKGKTAKEALAQNIIIGYDKNLMKLGQGTNVLHLKRVAFLWPEELEKNGISDKANPVIKREEERKNLVWGEEVNGLRAAVEFVAEKEEYCLGEIIGVRFHIKNVSDHRIVFRTAKWRNDATRCFLEDNEGKIITCSGYIYLGWPEVVEIKLDSGQVAALESASLGIAEDETRRAKFNHPVGNTAVLEPGTYKLYYTLSFPDVTQTREKEDAIFSLHRDWQGTLKTGKRDFIVTESN